MPRRITPPEPAEPSGDVLPDADAEPTPGETPSAPDPGFFGWIRRLDLPRRPGWLGGVCAGIAERLGVDPVLVRGVIVVVAVLGGPVALLYALAWFLLPDGNGTIHADELRRGRVSRAIPGIAAIFLLSFLPLAQGFWFAGAFYWGDAGWGGVVLRVLWTAGLIAAIIVAVVWLARRAGSDITTVPATTDERPETIPTFPADASRTAAITAAGSAPAAPGEPPPPPADASAEELAAWRAGQDEWQRQRSLWATEQRRAEQDRRRAEAQARARLAFEAARERARLNRLLRPRASAGVVALVFGVALISAAVAAVLAQGSAPTRGAEWLIGAAAATLVIGLGIMVVALARRRSGMLSLLGILSVVALAAAVVVPADRQLLPLGSHFGLDRSVDGRYAQFAGTTEVWVLDRESGQRVPVIDLWQYSGSIEVELEEGASVRLEVTTDADGQSVYIDELFDDGFRRGSSYVVRDGQLVATVGGGEPDLVLRVWMSGGVGFSVRVTSPAGQPVPLDPVPEAIGTWNSDGVPTPLPSSSPAPSSTEGAVP